MKYTVGKYVIVPEKPFTTMEKAVQYIQEKYPELGKESIEEHLTPKIDGTDKPNDVVEKNTVSQEIDTQNSAASSKGVRPGKDKSG